MKVRVKEKKELIYAVQGGTELIIVEGDLAKNIEEIKQKSPFKWKMAIGLLVTAAGAAVLAAVPDPAELLEIGAVVAATGAAGAFLGYSVSWFVLDFLLNNGGKEALHLIRENYDCVRKSETELHLIRKDPNAKNIVFLGSSGSGKTTCWRILKSENTNIEYQPTKQKDIDSFILNTRGKNMRISKTVDFGGTDSWVKYYDEIICHSNTIVFFLIDLSNLDCEEFYFQIRSRIQKISNIIVYNDFKHCKIQLIGTQLKKFDKAKGEPEDCIREWLHLDDLEDFDKYLLEDNIYCLELQNKEDKNKIIELVNI